MCGVTSPTKPMPPPTDTLMPIMALTQIITVSFTRRTDTPTCSAYSSPMLMALSARACVRMMPPQSSSVASSVKAFW